MTHVVMLLSNPFVSDPRVYAEAMTLTAHGYRVTVIGWDRTCSHPGAEEKEGISIQRIRIPATYGQGMRQIVPLLTFWWKLVGALRHVQADVIHCHDLDTLLPGWIAARRTRAKLVYDSHECYPAMYASHGQNRWVPRLLQGLDSFLSRRVDLVITVGQLLKERFEKMTNRPVVVVGNWKQAADFRYPSTQMAELAEQLAVNGRVVVSFIGNMNRDRAILPWLQVAPQVPDMLFVVAGRGDQEEEVKVLAGQTDNIAFLGFVPMQDVSLYTALSDVLYSGLNAAYPNNDYSAPNALFSALAAGNAILTTNLGDVARIVEEERCGVVLKSLEPGEMLAALDRFRDPQFLITCKANAARAYQRQYNWGNAEQILLNSYDQLLGRISEPTVDARVS